jgi:hypothetical protein
MVTGDDHVIVAVITGVPEPNVTVTDENGNVVPGEGQIDEIDDETIRFSLDLPNIEVNTVEPLGGWQNCSVNRGAR